MRISADFGETVTNVGYQFVDNAGLINTRVTTGISNPLPGSYKVDVARPSTAVGVRWSATLGSETIELPVSYFDPAFLDLASPGASGGLLIAGSNAATAFATLTSTGAMSINGISNVAQTGDSFDRLGPTGSGLTSLAPSSTALSSSVWTSGKAGFLDEAISAAKTLTLAERTAIANAVETEIISETDSEKVLTAITTKIAAVNPTLGELSLGAIAIAVRDVSNTSPSAGSLGAVLNARASQASVSAIPTNPLTTLGSTAPSGWINASAVAASALNGKGDWSLVGSAMNLTSGSRVQLATVQSDYAPAKAGDAMALASGAQSSLIAALEAELNNDSTGQAFLQAVAVTVRDAVLNRVLSGNHTVVGSVSIILQNLWTELQKVPRAGAGDFRYAGNNTTSDVAITIPT